MKIKFIKSEPQNKVFKLNLKSGKTITRKYIDDIQTVIAPTTPQITKSNKSNFEFTNFDHTIKDIKTRNAMNLVNMALNKGIIENEDRDLELQKILALDDDSFKSYQDEILNFDDTHEVSSGIEVDEHLTEAEKKLKQLRGGNKKDKSDGFKNYSPSSNDDEIRDLKQNNNRNIINDLYNEKVPKFEEEWENILSQKLSQVKEQEEPKLFEKKSNTFDNIQGPKKPIQIPSKQSLNSYKDLFDEFEWNMGKK